MAGDGGILWGVRSKAKSWRRGIFQGICAFIRDKKAKTVLQWGDFVVAGLAMAGSLTIWWLKATRCWIGYGVEPKRAGIAGIDVCKSFRILIDGGVGAGRSPSSRVIAAIGKGKPTTEPRTRLGWLRDAFGMGSGSSLG